MMAFNITISLIVMGIPSLFALNFISIKRYLLYRGKAIKSIIYNDSHLMEIMNQNSNVFKLDKIKITSKPKFFSDWYYYPSHDAEINREYFIQEINQKYKINVIEIDLYYACFDIKLDNIKKELLERKNKFINVKKEIVCEEIKPLEHTNLVPVENKPIERLNDSNCSLKMAISELNASNKNLAKVFGLDEKIQNKPKWEDNLGDFASKFKSQRIDEDDYDYEEISKIVKLRKLHKRKMFEATPF